MGENCNQLNHQGEVHHLPLLHPHPDHPHPHSHYVVNDEQRVAEISSHKLVTFGRKLAGADRCPSLVGSVVGGFG